MNRTGSTLLCKALESTLVAGKPAEWLHGSDGAQLYTHYGLSSPSELQMKLWELGSTPNQVLFPGCNERSCSRGEVWENAFPNGKHIFMTRRNKVRLAVSWWKAIQTQEWHREHGTKPTAKDVRRYSFDAINTLYTASVMREAGTQEFFTEAAVTEL